MKYLSILGSTGSIGTNTLEVVRKFPDRFQIKALAGGENIDLLARQIREFSPDIVAVKNSALKDRLAKILGRAAQVEILSGDAGYRAVAAHAPVHTVVSAMVGAAGLLPTLAAVKSGKTVALANKETLVMAGELVMETARAHGVSILPVDSEHSAIFQCLSGQRREDFARILLTASGGPFRERPMDTFDSITLADALNHPTWAMGRKITIDSATLMNKGLEVIEARFLFDIPGDQIEVVVHPQSIVHSMVAYRDGAVIAQMGVPHMMGAIAYAVTWPERLDIGLPLPDFLELGALTFEKPDMEKFPCLSLAYRALAKGKTFPAVMNAANEVAVSAFLSERIKFTDIPLVIEETLQSHDAPPGMELSHILEADGWARKHGDKMISRLAG